jgi:hypothetical protein
LFAIVFIATRNICFPYYVLATIPAYGWYFNDDPLAKLVSDDLRWYLFYALCILEVLHIYWAFLILKMVRIALMNKGVQDDIRNDKED